MTPPQHRAVHMNNGSGFFYLRFGSKVYISMALYGFSNHVKRFLPVILCALELEMIGKIALRSRAYIPEEYLSNKFKKNKYRLLYWTDMHLHKGNLFFI